MSADVLLDFETVQQQLEKAGVDVAGVLAGSTYRDLSTLVVIPSRGLISPKVVYSWLQLQKPLNHRMAFYFIQGDEVAVAYNKAIQTAFERSDAIGRYEYLLTLEDDNIVPPMSLLILLDAIHKHELDVVAGLYYMKSPMAIPMAFGRPGQVDAQGDMDFSPVDMTEAILRGGVVPVNGVACGCTLWRTSVFRDLEAPWFETFVTLKNDRSIERNTQDLAFCKRLAAAGKKLAVDARVKVGHLDVTTDTIY